jgi:hypothetical protein
MPLVNAEDLDTSAPEFLVEGMIPLTGTGFIWGESRWGKSLLTNGELALAVANGTSFFGRSTVQSSVAICLGEGLYDAGVRKQARLAREQDDRASIATQLGIEHGDVEAAKKWLDEQPAYDDTNVFYMTEPFVLPLDNGGAPTQSLRAAIDALKQVPDLGLVILDALSDFTPSLSISNDASANRIVQGMKKMARELDCVVLAVAHPTRDGSRMLGAGRLFNSSDFVIKMEPDGTTPDGFQAATVICEKNKYGPPFEPFGYYIDPCAWHEPVLDSEGCETGELDLVQSATVRPRDGSLGAAVNGNAPPPKPRKELPKLLPRGEQPDGQIKKKRTGIRLSRRG